eukprot:TRINITY_DN22913_c0_g1_i1.p1 TRINITY_DN22913_c0_g1~~TRINITY_DN22913_c0_g1_i1.p1  ORF type:complete len:402 (+),score=83.24 TRINITY_DN22913_c0_g1_i1:103-1308(+)
MVRSFKQDRCYFIAADFAAMFAIAIATVPRASTMVACGHLRMAQAAINMAGLMGELYTRPHVRSRDNYSDCVRLTLQVLACVCMAFGYYSGDSNNVAFGFASAMFIGALCLIFVKLILDGITELWLLCNKRRAKLQAFAWNERYEGPGKEMAESLLMTKSIADIVDVESVGSNILSPSPSPTPSPKAKDSMSSYDPPQQQNDSSSEEDRPLFKPASYRRVSRRESSPSPMATSGGSFNRVASINASNGSIRLPRSRNGSFPPRGPKKQRQRSQPTLQELLDMPERELGQHTLLPALRKLHKVIANGDVKRANELADKMEENPLAGGMIASMLSKHFYPNVPKAILADNPRSFFAIDAQARPQSPSFYSSFASTPGSASSDVRESRMQKRSSLSISLPLTQI